MLVDVLPHDGMHDHGDGPLGPLREFSAEPALGVGLLDASRDPAGDLDGGERPFATVELIGPQETKQVQGAIVSRRIDGLGVAPGAVDDGRLRRVGGAIAPTVDDLDGAGRIADRPTVLGIAEAVETKVQPGAGTNLTQRDRESGESGDVGEAGVQRRGSDHFVRLYAPVELGADAFGVLSGCCQEVLSQGRSWRAATRGVVAGQGRGIAAQRRTMEGGEEPQR